MRRPRTLSFGVVVIAAAALAWPSGAQPAPPDSLLALVDAGSLGSAGIPWVRSDAFLNQPWGLAGDGEGMWIVNGAGRNLVRFGAGGIEGLGRAGDLDALYGKPVRFLADAVVAADRTVWVADAGGHTVVGLKDRTAWPAPPPVVLGSREEPGIDDGHFREPSGLAISTTGVLFVSDTGNHRVQIFDSQQRRIATLGQGGVAGAGPGQLKRPARLALSTDNHLFIADSGNHRVVEYDVKDPYAPRELRTIGRSGSAGKAADQFDTPLGVAVDATFLYVADSGNARVQVIQRTDLKLWRTLDGRNLAGCGAPNGEAWGFVSDVAQDQGGNLYVAQPWRQQVLGCDASTRQLREDLSHGMRDLPYRASDTLHNAPLAVAPEPDGGAVVVEGEGQRLVRRLADGAVAWSVGEPGRPGSGSPAAGRFRDPADAAFLRDGRLVVSDAGNSRLVLLGPDGRWSGTWGEGILLRPAGLAVLADGGVAVADQEAGRIRRFDAAGAYRGDLADSSGPLDFAAPADVAADAAGNWFVSEPDRHVVRVLDQVGRPLRAIGEAGVAGGDFGHLTRPLGLALDNLGRLYVADSGNDRLQVFAADGSFLTTVGGRRGVGTGGLREPHGVAIGANGQVFIADTYNHRVQILQPAAEPWLPEAPNGFGRRDEGEVGALAEHDGRLYAGLGGSGGAAVWRRDGNGPWEPVAGSAFGDPANRGVTAFARYGDRLYAGVENLRTAADPATGRTIRTSTGGSIWRSEDGQGWTQVAAGGFGEPHQSGMGPFAAFGGQLYAGTRSVQPRVYPAQLWRSASGSAGSWERVRLDQIGRAVWSANHAVSALAVYSGTLLVGTCSPGGAQLWASLDGDAWHPVGHREPGAAPDTTVAQLGAGACVTSLQAYDGQLFAGLGLDERQMQPNAMDAPPAPDGLLRCTRCDGTDWEDAAAGGFGNPGNTGSLLLAPLDEPPFRYLYAFAGNTNSGLEVWRAPDGLAWEQVTLGGFGDDNNAEPGGGMAVAVYRGRLQVGTRNLAQGGELWSSSGTRPQVLPTAPAATAIPTPRPRPQPPTGRARYHQVDQWPAAPALAADTFAAPVDMAVATDGTVYLLDNNPARVLRLTPADRWEQPFGASGTGPDRLTRVTALALDEASGRIYIADAGTRRLVAFGRDGSYLATVLRDTEPADLAVRADGSLWLADRLSGAARRIGPDGSELERLEQFGAEGSDRFERLSAIAEEPGGRLWVADEDGTRLLGFDRDPAGQWLIVARLDLGQGPLYACSGQRLQALGPGLLLAGGCRLDTNGTATGYPADHRGSDLYGVGLRSANPAAGRYVALATYDVDRLDPANPTQPALVRYVGDRFDLVDAIVLARPFVPAVSDHLLDDPLRIDALPGGDVVVSDARALDVGPIPPPFFRRFSPAGQLVDTLAIRSFPSQSYLLMMQARLAMATGERGQVVGVARLDYGRGGSLEMASLAGTVKRRYCRDGACFWGLWIEPEWQTTLVNLNQGRGAPDYNYAATFDATRRTYVLLQLWASDPSDVAMPARLVFLPIDGRGRKTEVALDGTEREALWTDIDAGPDGLLHVLDTLNDRVLVLDGAGNRLHEFETPKDAWKVAGGPHGETFVLTTYGHVVRMATDGTVLSRFLALPTESTPPDALADLAVDAWGRVYVVDGLYDQVTAFDPEGTEDDVLQGDRCSLQGDKWVAPDEILLGDTAKLFLQLSGSCGFVEDDADIVLMMNAMTARLENPSLHQEAVNLRVARQIFSVTDLDRHRVGFGTYVISGDIDQPLTQNRTDLIHALLDVPTSRSYCGLTNTESALRTGRAMFQDSPPGRRKLLVLIDPDSERWRRERKPPCSWTRESVRAVADQLRAEGITILAVNGGTAACAGDGNCNIPVADRGQGTGRRAILQAVTRRWPDALLQSGTLTDQLPANIDYVAGSAAPPANWDPASRTLTWPLADLARGAVHRFSLTIRPRDEGLWPTNVQAVADAIDGWGRAQRVVLPIPKIRVYGELPPTPTFTPTRTATPTVTHTPEPTSTPRPTRPPVPIYLPILLKTEPCTPGTHNADVAVVIDSSGSMSETTSPGGPTKLDAAREAARAFILQLVAGRDQAALVQFNNDATLIEPLSTDIARVASGLDRLTQASGTRIDKALDLAATELSGAAHRPENNRVLILLTDGTPTGVTPDEVRASAERVKQLGILVYTIGLGQDVDHALLRDIAGRPEWYFFAPDTSDLAEIYGKIVTVIPCQPMWP